MFIPAMPILLFLGPSEIVSRGDLQGVSHATIERWRSYEDGFERCSGALGRSAWSNEALGSFRTRIPWT